jgi:hypothetical protein
MAAGLAARRAVVDVFAVGTADINLEAFECLSATGNGSIMVYPDLDNASLPQDLFARVQRSHGYECMLRLRCSRGFKVPAHIAFCCLSSLSPAAALLCPHSKP